MMWACASLMSRRNAAASSAEPCLSSQFTWPIILSRRSHNARTNISACAASRSPIEAVSQPVPYGASQAPVSGFQLSLHARGCAAQTDGSVLRPPYTGLPGVCIWYGPGAGVGSALAVPATTTAEAASRADDFVHQRIVLRVSDNGLILPVLLAALRTLRTVSNAVLARRVI